MQLQSGEKSILAYFPTDTKAMEAQEVLNQQGFNETQIDRVSSYPNTSPYGSSTATLATMVLGNQAYDELPSPLLASDPSASGMAGSHDLPGKTAFLLTLVTSEDKVNQAVQILKEHGASV